MEVVLKKYGKEKFNKLREFYERYERFLIPAALLFGFLTDAFTFRFLGLGRMTYIFFAHLIFAGINIGAVNYFEEKYPATKIGSYWEFLAPLFVQFSFGNLFNGFLIFYSLSGSLFASWPFLLMFVILFIGNELMTRTNVNLLIQVGVYFFVAFSYFNLAFPYLLKNLSVWVFLGSGLLSLLLVSLFIYLLSFYSERIRMQKKKLWITISFVFLIMNVLYFVNLIPPIPLSLKEVGVYHDLQSLNGHYKVLNEKCDNWDKCILTKKKIHITEQREPIYVFSAVHAPSGMTLSIAHEWRKYDEEENKWIEKSRLSYEITGGRKEGYRFFTYKHVTPGHWRVSIETKRGQVIGRKSFHVVKSNTSPKLIEEVK